MRCRAGDLAVVIRAVQPRNVSILVRVIRRLELLEVEGVPCHQVGNDLYRAHPDHPVVWEVESLGRPFLAIRDSGEQEYQRHGAFSDRGLRPIRDGEGVDETLRNLEMTQ
jgi:hypothetical protein